MSNILSPNIFKILEPNIDQHGLVVHNNPEGVCGGDSCNRSAFVAIADQVLNSNNQYSGYVISKLLTPNGFIRHPDKGYNCGKPGYTNYECWADYKNFSGDQSRALLSMFVICNKKYTAAFMLMDIKNKRGRFQNNDFAGPTEYATLYRAINHNNRFLLMFGDFILLLSVLITMVKFKINNSTDGYINGYMLALASTQKFPTMFGKLAYKLVSIHSLQAWQIYFGFEGNPKLDKVLELVLNKIKESK